MFEIVKHLVPQPRRISPDMPIYLRLCHPHMDRISLSFLRVS